MAVKSYDELAKTVTGQGGIAVVDMGALRDIEGAGKLGKYVRQSISDALNAHGMGHLPEELPIYQHEQVRVYKKNSPVGQAVAAVLHPSTAGDATLRAVGGDDAREKLEQIKRIIAA